MRRPHTRAGYLRWGAEEDATFDRLVASGDFATAADIAKELTRLHGEPVSRNAADCRYKKVHGRTLGADLWAARKKKNAAGTAEPSSSDEDPPTLRSQRAPMATEPEITIEWEEEPAPEAAHVSATGDTPDESSNADVGYVPRPPRGPTDKPHYIPVGHELGGVSRLTNADGHTKAEWSKTRVAGADQPPVPVPESFLLDKASVMRRGDGSTVVEWASYKRDAVERWESIKAAVSEHVAEYVRPALPVEAPEHTDDDLLVVYPLGDPHIGMLAWAEEVGESFDLAIAERELCECMRQLVARSPASSEAIVTNLGDFWHAENERQTTPKNGNKLDVDGRAGKVGRVGLRILRTLVDTALTKHARVRVRSVPGNHDPNSSFWIPLYLQAVYENDPRVIVEDGVKPYQFDVFGKCLLGWCHGDGAKVETLGEIMATDVPELWGAASFRFWNVGHVHHTTVKELRGCVVETHRTLAGRDAWHHHSGYRSGRSLKAIAYHRLYGLDSVAVVGVERVRAALSVGEARPE